MAITKIHPIKSTLDSAINYITDTNKTKEQILVSSFKCNPVTAHTQFLKTREDCNTHGSVLARHLIQSFAPGEVTPELAHEIGIALCNKILKEQYEYIVTTHVDQGHIHNHIIFNNVNHVTGKCYQSNKCSYHQIRYQSDILCKENKLSVIDEYYEQFKKKYKTRGKSWYENELAKQRKSWKSRLQFDIDRSIQKAKDWEDFLSLMNGLDYEIKFGKHIAFRHKDKDRFTRAKIIGEDFTEDRLKERIKEAIQDKQYPVKKRVGNLIDMDSQKVKNSKGYQHFATKHNLKTIAEAIIFMREQGIKSAKELDTVIQNEADKIQSFLGQIKVIEDEIDQISQTMEQLHTIQKYREIYQYHKKNPNDKDFENEYRKELQLYIKSALSIQDHYKKVPSSKDILNQIEVLQSNKDSLIKEYKDSKITMNQLYQLRKNYNNFIKKEVER